ncbi:ribonucleases P/MRP protein subunit POP1 [Schistocerca serialis cubense]|uniref:ribonucleases P/MRP protein subunit POP1 n=1 Tax=Schistocerca serialis cubense TaxID=2023355 RepID=UPI00214E1E99|nr:ribonucleases P/MRP protein subunit POP1 [Schistocerca serialis cubense]XP_049958862.1 ribonucleases P/MRP protein subunit POP1 [Schistocerca serialis cubense]
MIMASSRQQFDSLLGGQSHLPSGVNILHIISARAQEIEALTEAIDDPQRSGLVIQRLPKHMRRRIMSHNVKRMPRRLREAHLRQMEKSGLPLKSKRPSRKYRRRPSNLLQEYNRRQRKFIWLETHIWHAKRFHMIEKWGYKLPNFPNDKSFRACYRASANHCLLQDVSYYCCIELCGPLDEIIDGLKQHTDKACGLTFAAKVYISGSREGNITVFRKKSYPYGAIGNISFLWRPSKVVSFEGKDVTREELDERTLWLWIHPAFYEEFCDELIDTFNFVESNMDITETIPSAFGGNAVRSETSAGSIKHKRKGPEKKVEIEKIGSKVALYNRTRKFESSSGHVKMTFLKDTLNRFSLTGPLSHSILQDALHFVSMTTTSHTRVPFVTENLEKLVDEISTSNVNTGPMSVESFEDQSDKTKCVISYDDNMEVDEPAKDSQECEQSASYDCEWWHDICSDTYSLECVKIQKQLWETLKGAASPAQLPPHSVLALIVTDPRRYLPAKRMKCNPDSDVLWSQELPGSGLQSLPPQSVVSPLWTAAVRDAVTTSKPSATDIAHNRSYNVIPLQAADEHDTGDTSASLSSMEGPTWQKVPILLLQRPGSQNGAKKRLGFGCGWDIILPAGWAMPFWQALVFRGARVGGLREATALSFEGLKDFGTAFLPPDTKSGALEDTTVEKHLQDIHFRLPPDKRPNFATLGIVSPFKCPWNLLINEWSDENFDEHDKNYLNQMSFYVLRDRKKLDELECELHINSRKKKPSFDTGTLFDSDDDKKCLVPVCVVLKDKGVPTDFSIICVPTDEDLKRLSSCESFPGPIEPLHEDEKKQERKKLQHDHKKKLKYLRKQRHAEKRKLIDSNSADVDHCENVSDTMKDEKTTATKSIVEEHATKMRELWMPNAKTVRKSCSREIIGFIYKGGFSFSDGIGMGLGYIPLPALLSFIKSPYLLKPWILVRNKNSQQYRYAMLHIHCET